MIKYLSLFSGIGAFEKALDRIGIEYELVGFSEIDKYAIKSYCAVHNVDESLNLGDISKIDLDKLKGLDIDLITHGSPCQDFSIAGRLAGGDKGSGTRSSLMWCTVDIVEVVQPKYVIWENVKNVLSAKNRHNFDRYLEVMNKIGYNNYYQVLNAKNYGIPQNRERVFTISIRKDVDTGFEFPEKQELKLKLKDMLEENVDKKYYLSNKLMTELTTHTEAKTTDIQMVGKLDIKGHDCVKRVYSEEGVAPTLTDMQGGNRQPKIITVGNYMPSNHDASRIVDEEGIAPTVKENHGTVTAVAIKNNGLRIKEATKAGYKEAYAGDGVNISGRMKYQRGNVQKDMCQTIMSSGSERGVVTSDMRIRKLAPRECWKLMGFDNEDFDKAKAIPTSDTQLYKQAGNSIVVNVLEAIFKKLFC